MKLIWLRVATCLANLFAGSLPVTPSAISIPPQGDSMDHAKTAHTGRTSLERKLPTNSFRRRSDTSLGRMATSIAIYQRNV